MDKSKIENIELEQQFLESLTRQCSVKKGDAILVAWSGGADSTALLQMLLRHRAGLSLRVEAVTVDHGLRPETELEIQHCRQLAKELDVPWQVVRVDTPAAMAAGQLSEETAARNLRRQVLIGLGEKEHFDAIALGHHADDQVETVLANVIRGTGLRGLAGMPWKLHHFIRPCLLFSCSTLRAYLQQEGIAWVEDRSNLDVSHRRNYLRHRLLPEIRAHLQPGVDGNLLRLAGIAADAEVWLQHQATEALSGMIRSKSRDKIVLEIKHYPSYFRSVRKYILRDCIEAVSRQQVKPSANDLRRIDELVLQAQTGKRHVLRNGLECLLDHDGLVVWHGPAKLTSAQCEIGASRRFGNLGEFCVREVRNYRGDLYKQATAGEQYIDADQVAGSIRIRPAKPDDRFQPLGMGGSKALSKFFTDQKVPLHKRAEIPVIACDSGIIWVVGQRLDDRFKLTGQTTRSLHLEFKDITH